MGQKQMQCRGDSGWSRFWPDFKVTFVLWLPIFAVVMWMGIQRGFQHIALFAIAMGLAVWSICDAAVLVFNNIRDWLAKRSRTR